MAVEPIDDARLRARPIDPDRIAAFYRAQSASCRPSACAGWVVFDRRH